MARIYVGTCSWTDPTLLASGFYPSGVNTPEKRLAYYAGRFTIVEVDSTYYGLPSERNSALWVRRTPADFVFNIKAFSLFTQHPTPANALPKGVRDAFDPLTEKGMLYHKDLPAGPLDLVWEMFKSALLPLDSAGKLGAVLFQFPHWFLPCRDSREHILTCRERLGQYRMAVEFRNGLWVDEKHLDETMRFLRQNELCYVSVDEPQGFRSSVPPVAEATTDLSIVRFHGRNRETWEKRGVTATERFRYLYSQEEIEEWAPRIQRLASQAQNLHVLFNNCYGDYAVRNAQDVAGVLRSLGLEVQKPPVEPTPTSPPPGPARTLWPDD
ncbi:MAG: DUF72 domain-containing protein [Dehalococcoidia bacterium]|nr:DUF72 domain-containing protein [Dehalococcoidia bacterium]